MSSRGASFVPLALILLGSAACSPQPRTADRSRILVLGFDGLDPLALDTAIGEGSLPAFARLRSEGACGELEVDPPLLSPVVWTTIATGRSPLDHGIGHFTARDAQGREIPVTSGLRRVPALWNLWSDWNRKVAVVGWWATWPAEPIRGVLVSDRVGYHFLDSENAPDISPGAAPINGLVHPAERQADLLRRLRDPRELDPRELAGFVDPGLLAEPPNAAPGAPAGGFSFADDLSHLRWAVSSALSYRDLGLELWRRDDPDLLLVYFEGTDSVSHLFGHLHRRRDLAGELEVQRRLFGGAVDAMYGLADRILQEFLSQVGSDTTVVVLSDHGFRLGELPTDPSTTRDSRRVSDRYHRDRGVLCFLGRGVRPGAKLDRPRPIDLVPTLVSLAGLPLSAELPGRPLSEALAITPGASTVASYGGRTAPPEAAPSPGGSPGDQALLEQLRSLGYLGAGNERSDSSERNLAFIALRERRYREAARAFERLTRESPGEAALHTGLASAFAGLEREAEARREFAAALALDPIFVPALHNRGLLEERLGRREAALADYRLALRYDPAYEPSRAALRRLGAGSGAPVASAPAQLAAQKLLEAGNGALRHGDYAAARSAFDEAHRLAPESAAPLHGLANVAYLTRDRALAIRYLEAALAIEPDNALFRSNLEKLRRSDLAPAPAP